MADKPVKATDIKYLNKDFQSFKRDLMRYAQAHFSGSFKDYNEASPGMMLLETQAYIADVLSFYMDQQFLEIRKETARQVENVESFAKMRGYKPKGKRAATVPVYLAVEVPAGNGGQPDPRYLPVIQAGTRLQGPNNVVFETVEDLDLSKTNQNGWEAVQSRANYLAVRAKVMAIGAKTVTEVLTVGDFKPYLRLTLSQPNVIDVLDVIDEQGNRWYEVEYLAQNAVFDQITNNNADSDVVPYVLRYRAAPRRFVVDRSLSNDTVSLQFGNGDGLQYNDELIPNIAQMALPIAGRKTFTNFALDPQNFLKTSTLGLSPYNTRLMAKYRVGGGDETNVDAMSINKVITAYFNDFGDKTDASFTAKVNAVKSSISCINLEASSGGGPAETVAEVKVNADSFFAAQNRAVTKEDYLTHVLSLPPKFGRVEKAYVKPSEYNPYAVDLHVLTLDSNGFLSVPSETLKQNIKKYFEKLRMVTEGINIMPAYVINIGVQFGIVVSPQFNRSEVLTVCLTKLKDHLKTENMQVGSPIVLSDLRSMLQQVRGVISVYKMEIISMFGNSTNGLSYNQNTFDVNANTKHGIVYAPPDSIFEIRYPTVDIIGETK